MKKVIIRCFSNCSILSKCHIIIFDKYDKKVYQKNTGYGKVELYLRKDVYKMLVIPLNIYSSILSTSFIVKDDINCFNLCLKSNDNSLKITAILLDKNYDNLPIERGEIKLWQDRIQ